MATFVLVPGGWHGAWSFEAVVPLLERAGHAVHALTLTGLRVISKNLLPCIILHTIFNGIQSIMLIAQPWFDHPSAPDQTASFLNLLK